MITDTDTTALALLAERRMNVEILSAEKQRRYDAWLAENADLLAALKVAQDATAESEAVVRNEAVARYHHDGNKKQPGVTIRVVKRLIYDPAQALAWAIEHRLCLGLDRKAFEGLAKSQPIEGVTVSEEPTAAIDSDLSAWLGKTGVAE